MKVERTTKDDPEDGNDTFRITMPGGVSKVFKADPFTGDKKKIKTVWDWINTNYNAGATGTTGKGKYDF